jgi:hypothetical protein
MRMCAANGDVRDWEYHNSEQRLSDGRRIVRGLAHDVTEQLKAVRELRQRAAFPRAVRAGGRGRLGSSLAVSNWIQCCAELPLTGGARPLSGGHRNGSPGARITKALPMEKGARINAAYSRSTFIASSSII